MTYRYTRKLPSGVTITFDAVKVADRVAAYLEARPSITTDAAWDAHVAGLTSAQVETAVRLLLKAIITVE